MTFNRAAYNQIKRQNMVRDLGLQGGNTVLDDGTFAKESSRRIGSGYVVSYAKADWQPDWNDIEGDYYAYWSAA